MGALGGWGIVDGYEDGGYHPQSPIKRVEFVAILARFFPLGKGVCTFTDVSPEHWAYDEIALAQQRGWVDGCDDGIFRPYNGIVRSEAVCIINRVLGRSADKGVIEDEKPVCYWDVTEDCWAYYDILEATLPHEFEIKGEGERWTAFTDVGLALPDGTYYKGLEIYRVGGDGCLLRDVTLDGLYLGEDGRYTSGVEELDAAVKSVLASVVKPDMTREEMLSAAFNFVRDKCTYRKAPVLEYGATGWEAQNALDMLNVRKGNCYGFAAAFAYLARQIGYDAVAISGELRNSYTGYTAHHGWVVITQGESRLTCDPQLEWSMQNVHGITEDLYMKAPGETGNWQYYYCTADGELIA